MFEGPESNGLMAVQADRRKMQAGIKNPRYAAVRAQTPTLARPTSISINKRVAENDDDSNRRVVCNYTMMLENVDTS